VKVDQGHPFEIQEERLDGSALIMHLCGEFDLASLELLDGRLDRLVTGDVREVEVDLADLDFIDSSGIQALLAIRRRARGDHIRLRVILPEKGQVRNVLSLTGLDSLFHSEPGV
jgi:anti-sigma B factor antagonist